MGDELIHFVSLKLVDRLDSYAKNEGKDYLKLLYGMEVIVTNVFSLTILFVLSLILGTLIQSVAVLVGFNVIRRNASGAHAANSISCGLSSSVLFIIVPWLLRGYTIDNFVVAPVFCTIMTLLCLYAPADTESKPLVGKKKRARLRKHALIAGALLMAVTLLIGDNSLKTWFTLGAVYETISILPITYRVLNKKYRNYKYYEKPIVEDLVAL